MFKLIIIMNELVIHTVRYQTVSLISPSVKGQNLITNDHGSNH